MVWTKLIYSHVDLERNLKWLPLYIRNLESFSVIIIWKILVLVKCDLYIVAFIDSVQGLWVSTNVLSCYNPHDQDIGEFHPSPKFPCAFLVKPSPTPGHHLKVIDFNIMLLWSENHTLCDFSSFKFVEDLLWSEIWSILVIAYLKKYIFCCCCMSIKSSVIVLVRSFIHLPIFCLLVFNNYGEKSFEFFI